MENNEPEEDDLADAMPLIAQLIQSNYNQYASTSQSLLDTYEAQIKQSNAVIDSIRDRIRTLLNGDYMPTTRAIMDALYPSAEEIQYYMEESEK